MTVYDPLLKTQQVARALGVSVSTIKRWVDLGSLPATRTVGKHRLIPLSSAIEFARGLDLPLDGLASHAAFLDGISYPTALDDQTRDNLLEALTSADTDRAKQIIVAAHQVQRDAVALADHLIRPVMERIGHGWEGGSVHIYQEHQASQAVMAAVTELIERAPRLSDVRSPLALGASPGGDLYTMPLLLGELVLREAGWRVQNLGPNLPLAELAAAVTRYRPRLVFLSVNYVEDADRFAEEYETLYRAASAADAALIIGGRALGPDLRAKLIYASFGERMAHLSEFARRLASFPGAQSAGNAPGAG